METEETNAIVFNTYMHEHIFGYFFYLSSRTHLDISTAGSNKRVTAMVEKTFLMYMQRIYIDVLVSTGTAKAHPRRV